MTSLKTLVEKLKDAREKLNPEFRYIYLMESELLKLLKVIEVATEALTEIKTYGHAELCKVMKPYRENYRCAYEDADAALAEIERLCAGEE